jgi:pSer/pThr/pTyr-binding forkhead associated (FHA) protein
VAVLALLAGVPLADRRLDEPGLDPELAEAEAVVDLGSTNGVKVNGRRVDTSRLAPGDEVSLGTVTFIFDIEQ